MQVIGSQKELINQEQITLWMKDVCEGLRCTAEQGIVHRDLNKDLIYPVVERGFYVGDQKDFSYYSFPSEDDLQGKFSRWWSSATSVSRF